MTTSVLYVTTGQMMGRSGDDGIFRVALDGASPPEYLGLAGKGGVRGGVLVDADDPATIVTATAREGVWRSRDAGATWEPVNAGLVYLEVWSLARHPRTGTYWLGTGPAAVWRSDDLDEGWGECRHLRTLPSQRDWTFPGPPFLAHVKHIGLHADDPDLVFGAVEEGWCIRSRDGGKTWVNLKDGVSFDLHTANVMPDDPSIVVCTAGTGVYRSKDGGDTFVESKDGLERRYMSGIVVHPDRPERLFTAAAEVPPPFWARPEGASGALYRSDDQGQTWSKLAGGLPEWFHAAPRSLAGDPGDPDCVFVGMTDGAIWMTRDGGGSFAQIAEGLPPVTAIAPAPTG